MAEPSILELLERAGRTSPRLKLRALAGETPSPEAARAVRTEGRYAVFGEIARGGIGLVLRGRDLDLGRDVAMKVLLERHTGTRAIVRRFVEEARIGGRLQHPGVVPVYEFGLRTDRRPFFTMKLVRGRTLADLLEERAEPPRILAVFSQVCQTVAYAHARGVVHRDLKPDNVMVGRFGEVHVLDWGFAKVLRQAGDPVEPVGRDEGATTTGSEAGAVMGTPAYMPPEQARGRVEELDARADVFALGAILCKILTGRPPYTQDPLRQAARADIGEAERRLAASDAHEDLVALCRACLSPLPEDRPRDAGVVAEAVTDHLASVEERAHRSRLAAVVEQENAARAHAEAEAARARASEQRRGRRQIVALAASVLVALLVAGGVWLRWTSERAGRARRTTLAVNQAIRETRGFEGRGEWRRAIAAAQRARALAEEGEGSGELQATVAALLARVTRAGREARDAQARAAADAALVGRLEEIRQRVFERFELDPVRVDAAYAGAFRRIGIELERLTPEAAAEKLQRRSNVAELAGALDDWAALRLEHPELRPRGWRSLAAVACALDRQPDVQVARAIATGDLARLRDLAQHLNLVTHSARQADRLAALLAAQGETLSAVELLRRAQKQYPGAFWIHRRLASLALRLDPPRYDEAVAGCTMALALRPGQACVLSQLGVARRLGGDHEGALAAHRRAVETEPSHASHHCRLGAELQELGYLTEALRNCRRAVEISPESPAAHGLLGRVLQAQGELSAAVAEFRRSRQLREGDPAIHYRLGNALLEQGDPAGAVTALLRAAELSPDDPRVHSSLGVAALRAGDPARALAALRTAVARGPGLAPARYNLAVALHRRGDLDGATAALRQAFDLDRQLEEAHSYRDAVLVDEGTFDGAQAVFAKAVARAPNDVDLRCDLGLVLGLRREHGKARAALQAALELDPEHGRVYAQLGALLKRMARWNEALEVLRQALALSPDNADVHADIGYVLAKKGAFRRAEAPLLRALEIDPDHAAARTHLGITYVMLGKLQAGLEELERAIQLAPRRHNPHNILGSILVNHRVGFERATRAFHTAIRLDPGNARYHANLGMVLGLEGDAQRALACHRKAAELDPASPEPLTGIGIILCYTAGDFEAALEQFQAALRLAPRSPVLHRHKGIALRSMGRYEEAAAALRKAVALNPNSAGFHLDLAGLLLTRMDDSAGAVPHLQEAIRLNPRYGLPHRHLGLALRRLGKTREAIAALDRAVELAPDFVVALQDLAWLLATCEERDLRDPERAVELAERAYRLRPGPETCRFLGAALSRSGKHADALATLEYGAASHPQGGGFHLRAWLAIVHARLGHEREARRWYQRAREGFRADTPDRDEWQRLLDEAQALIEGLR